MRVERPCSTKKMAYFIKYNTSKNAATARVSTFELPNIPASFGVIDYIFQCSIASVTSLSPAICFAIAISSHSIKGSKSFSLMKFSS